METFWQFPNTNWNRQQLKGSAHLSHCVYLFLCVCVCMCEDVFICVRVSHLSHRRPPKPSLHRHDPAGWAVNQAHTHERHTNIYTEWVSF